MTLVPEAQGQALNVGISICRRSEVSSNTHVDPDEEGWEDQAVLEVEGNPWFSPLSSASCQGSGGATVLEAFKGCVDVALRDMVSGHGGDELTVGLDDLRGLFQP